MVALEQGEDPEGAVDGLDHDTILQIRSAETLAQPETPA
jgi:hypothetical protein